MAHVSVNIYLFLLLFVWALFVDSIRNGSEGTDFLYTDQPRPVNNNFNI